ncbi:MAG: helix-turn-helix transcriptional regulator [Phycisphaerae bacterium]|nr:helix-turn-helix transcriptional regulator [Phycisphaerae bacterium]
MKLQKDKIDNHQLNLIPAPIESISGIWKFSRPANHVIKTTSLSEHLLQLITNGSYAIRTNNREYTIKKGDLIYYYAREEVQWLKNDNPVEFYSVGFCSKAFKPIPLDHRVFASNNTICQNFEELYTASINSTDKTQKTFSTHLYLTKILLEITHKLHNITSKSQNISPWWLLENTLLQKHIFRPSLDQLANLANTSRASIVRLCRKATGQSPIKRIQAIRMEEARALLTFSSLNITEISLYLKYPRVHEFSREFSCYFNISPTELRNKNLQA